MLKRVTIYNLPIIIILGFLVACSTTKDISKEKVIIEKNNIIEKDTMIHQIAKDSLVNVTQVPEIKEPAYESGFASWYGPKYHGRLTANGERFNQYALTAAHKTLPFNTMVKVVSKSNNKSVTVRINDRGPFIKGRIIDLSRKSAEQIDLIQKGFENVDIFIITDDKIKASLKNGKKK